ncbi:MAG: hypothetical protein IKJ19_08020 [Clostridia bacterium]|nr:hypothetical protein [Clostridia bacterium]
MFGYVKPDIPYLYMKDNTLYKALYCGICKSIGKCSGTCARFTLTYDCAFLSAVIHNILGKDVVIKREHCIIHPITKRPIAKPDDISISIGALNVILAYFKIVDDINDNGRGRLAKLLLNGAFKRAKKREPELERIVRENYAELSRLEKAGESSIDRIADPFANLLAQLSEELLGDKKTQESYQFFYNFGKWIYLIDALDDYDKDVKKGNYNPFYVAYKAQSFKDLKQEKGEEVSFIMSATLSGIEQGLKGLKFAFNADLIRNISIRGTVETTKKVLLKGQKGDNK